MPQAQSTVKTAGQNGLSKYSCRGNIRFDVTSNCLIPDKYQEKTQSLVAFACILKKVTNVGRQDGQLLPPPLSRVKVVKVF